MDLLNAHCHTLATYFYFYKFFVFFWNLIYVYDFNDIFELIQ